MAGAKEYHVALFKFCSDEQSFFETFVVAESPEEAMKKGVDLALEQSKIPEEILEAEKPVFVCVSDEEDEYHFLVFPYKEGGYEYKNYEPLFDLQECNEEEDKE